MGRRGFKSADELVITRGPNGAVMQRPDAPYTLNDEEADEWRSIVGAMNPDYFARSHYPMLCQLCRHVVMSNRIAQLIDSTCKQKKLDENKLAVYLKMQSVESAAIVNLSRQMRLSHQSIYRADSTAQRPSKMLSDAPWNADE